MNAYLLLVKCPYKVELLEKEVEALIAKLPVGSRRVLYTDQVLGFLVPQAKILEMQTASLRPVMANFSTWWILEVTGKLICRDGSADPFRHWMDEFFGKAPVQRPKPQHVPLNQRRQPRGKLSINDGVDGAIGKVILQSPAGQDGSKEPD